jgi:putative ABC transport system permease protein
VLAQKIRLLMTVTAVLLGVAFVSGTLVFTDTIGQAQQNRSAKSFKNVSLAVEPGYDDSGNELRLSQHLLNRLRALPGTESVTGAVSGFTAVAGKDGTLLGDGFSTQGGNYYPGKDGKDLRYALASGRAPATAGEVALDSGTARKAGFRVGDTVRLSTDGPVRERALVGVFSTDDGYVSAGGSLVLFDNTTAQKMFAAPGQYDEITLKAAPGTSEKQLMAEARKVLPDSAEAVTGTRLAAEQATAITQQNAAMSQVLLVFAGISLFVGVFVIANTFTMLIAQRTRELALLRAVGASRRQVSRSVLFEALLLGLCASLAGFALGIVIADGMRAVLNVSGLIIPDGPLVVAPGSFLTSIAVGVVVTVLAAYLPARRAAKVPPLAAMSTVHTPPSTRALKNRNALGTTLAGLGTALVAYGASSASRNAELVGATLLITGVFVLTPLLSRPVISAAAPLLTAFGVSGRLAQGNALRNPRRTAATASALMIGLSLVTGLTVTAVSMSNAIEKTATDAYKADFVISMSNFSSLSPEVAEKVAGLHDTTASSPMRLDTVTVGSAEESVFGVSAEDIGKLISPAFISGSLKALGGNTVVADTVTAQQHGWKTGQTVSVKFSDGVKGTLRIGGVYRPTDYYTGIMAPVGVIQPHLKKTGDWNVLVDTRSGADEKARASIRHALGDNPVIEVRTVRDIAEQSAGKATLVLNILYGLLAMAVFIAVIGVVNTLAMSVFERAREIGMLRAIGLDRAKVKQMIRLESLLISLFGAVLGIALGVFLAWAAGSLVRTRLDTYRMTLPLARIAFFLLGAAAVGILAGLWPARRAAAMNILSAIKTN